MGAGHPSFLDTSRISKGSVRLFPTQILPGLSWRVTWISLTSFFGTPSLMRVWYIIETHNSSPRPQSRQIKLPKSANPATYHPPPFHHTLSQPHYSHFQSVMPLSPKINHPRIQRQRDIQRRRLGVGDRRHRRSSLSYSPAIDSPPRGRHLPRVPSAKAPPRSHPSSRTGKKLSRRFLYYPPRARLYFISCSERRGDRRVMCAGGEKGIWGGCIITGFSGRAGEAWWMGDLREGVLPCVARALGVYGW